MHRIAVFIDDSDHARRVLSPFVQSTIEGTQWVLVGCAPLLPYRVARWLHPDQRSRARADWFAHVQSDLGPLFRDRQADSLEWHNSAGRVASTFEALRFKHGTSLRILDLRRGRPGRSTPPILTSKRAPGARDWGVPVAVASSLTLMLALTD